MAKKSKLSKQTKSFISLLVLLVSIGAGWLTTSDSSDPVNQVISLITGESYSKIVSNQSSANQATPSQELAEIQEKDLRHSHQEKPQANLFLLFSLLLSGFP